MPSQHWCHHGQEMGTPWIPVKLDQDPAKAKYFIRKHH